MEVLAGNEKIKSSKEEVMGIGLFGALSMHIFSYCANFTCFMIYKISFADPKKKS